MISTHQVWQEEITLSPGKYSLPFQVHGHSFGLKHISPYLKRLLKQQIGIHCQLYFNTIRLDR